MKALNLGFSKKYSVIYADPPWDVKRGPDWGSNGKSKPLPYPTMSIESIKKLRVKEISEKDAYLFLWVINKYIPQAYEIAKEWGFRPVCLITWCKPKHGLGIGGTFVQTTEYLLFARRGTKKAKRRIDTTWFLQKRLKHSEKPDFFREMIEKITDGTKIELFARTKQRDWDVWGNQVISDISLTGEE